MKIAYVMFSSPVQDPRLPRHGVNGRRTEFIADETLTIDLENGHYLLACGSNAFLVPASAARWSEILQDVPEAKRGPGRPKKVV